MATKPPPYSPRDAARVQREAARAQRYYWRSMRRPSLVGPVLLIVIGTIALLVEIGKISAFQVWDWYVRWWPLLLIGLGLISLGEWWFDRDNPYGRRRSYGGVVALILLLALIGYTHHGMHGFGVFGDQDDNVFHIFGQEHDADRSLNQELPPGALVDIHVPRGDVTITPSGDSQIHVQAHEVVYASSDEAAQRAFDSLQPELKVNGKNVVLRAAGAGDGRADLTIEIPPDATATVTAGRGDVTAEGLKTTVDVTAVRGDVKFESISAPVHARMSKGDFTAHAIIGDVSLEGKLDDVNIADVQGRSLMDGDFFGDTHLAHVTSEVHFHSSRTDIELANLAGDLSLDSGDLQLDRAKGPIRISTRAKDVACTQVSGDLNIEDNDGQISVSVAGQPGETQIHNRNGEINFSVPPNANFQLEATARDGNIESALNLSMNSTGSGHVLSGTVGKGGPKVQLTADHGDIHINTSDEAPPPPPAPETPVVPAPPEPPSPGKTPRHLRAPSGDSPKAQTL